MTEQEYRDEIYKKADAVKSKDDLDNLLSEITGRVHDYSSIVYGCMAADGDGAADAVKTHWQNIVQGNIPFGFKVKEQ